MICIRVSAAGTYLHCELLMSFLATSFVDRFHMRRVGQEEVGGCIQRVKMLHLDVAIQ